MKTLLLLGFSLSMFLSWSTATAQILKTTNLDLNPGGVIYDTKEVPKIGCYVVVGNFTSIGGVTANKIAFINTSDFTVNTSYTGHSALSNINDVVYSVEVYETFIFGGPPAYNTTATSHIYIGGKFTSINSNAHSKLAHIKITSVNSATPTLTLSSWNPNIDFGNTDEYIHDMELTGDTLIVAGDFLEISPNNYQYGIGAYKVPSNALLNYLDNALLWYDNGYNTINFLNGELFASANNNSDGRAGILLTNGQWDPSLNFNSAHNTYSELAYDFNMLNDTLMLLIYGHNGNYGNSSNEYTMFNINNGAEYRRKANPGIPNLNSVHQSLIYKHYLFTGTASTSYAPYLSAIDIDELGSTDWNGGVVTPASIVWDAQVTTPLNEKVHKQLFVENNHLFVSATNLASTRGQPRQGLAIYCLEPKDPENFTQFDLNICEGDTSTYTIPQTTYADGYRWAYTGTGAQYRITGTAQPFTPLTNTNIADITANSIEIEFGPGATSGTLTVQPFSLCNTTTDYLYAKEKSIAITVAALPNLTLVEDTLSFTCARDSFYLIAESTTNGATFEWEYQSAQVGTNDSLLVNQASNVTNATYHHITVTEPINSCKTADSVFIYYDTVAVPIDVNDIVSTPAVFDCNAASLSLNLPISNATIGWDLSANATTPAMSAFTIFDANDSLSVYAYATYSSNGCTAKQGYTIATDQTPLTGVLTGYPNFGSVTVIDSLWCNSSTLDLTCDIAAGNGNAQWLIGGVPAGNVLNLTQADTTGMSAFNTNTYRFFTINNDNGCTDTLDATVQFDFEVPFVAQYSGANSFNCSALDLLLIHPVTGGNVTEGWLDANSNQTLDDSLLVSAVGDYYYQVQSIDNGCVNTDTVTITQTTELLLDLPNDTLICPGQVATITAVPINNTETIAYSWSTGATTQSIDITGGADNQVSVIAQTVSGCVGYDTIQVLITPPVEASFETSNACNTGAIQVTNVSGGAGNYQYSLDQVNWQTSASFTHLNFGDHDIYIQDDLNCIYSFTQTISQGTGIPDVNFLVSTYNGQGDTLAIVNISEYTGFDSLVWELPGVTEVYSIDDSMVVLSIPGGGWYDITLIGYQDTCGYSFTKPVYFGDQKPDFNQEYDAMGIQSLLIYPNPTTGSFTLELTYGVEQNYTIVVTNMQGQPMAGMSVTGVGSAINETFSFPSGSPPGAYAIHIISDFDGVQKTIILN